MKASYALGLCYIISVSIIWSAASILVQYLYQNLEFDSPFLLTYIGTSLLMILIPIYMIHVRRGIIWECLYKFLTYRQWSILRSRSTNIGGVNSPSALYIRDSSSNDDTRLLSSPSASSSASSLENIQSSPTRKSNNINENTIIHNNNNNNNNDDEINNENVDEEYHLDDTNIFYNDSMNNNISSHLEHFKLAVKVAPFWFISNYFYNVSLQYTTIT